MMGRLLNNHSKIFTLNELHFFGPLWEKEKILSKNESIQLFARLLGIQQEGFLTFKTSTPYLQEAAAVISKMQNNKISALDVYSAFLEYQCRQAGKVIPCEQTPVNVFYLKEILHLLNDSYIINMVRDPRDVLLSQKNKWKRKFLGAKAIPLKESIRAWFNYHPFTISKMWNKAVSIPLHLKDHSRILTVQFEKLLENPESEIKQICHFLNIDFENAMLQIPKVGSSGRQDERTRYGFDTSVISQWEKGGLNRTEIEMCEQLNHKLILNYGYEYSGIKGSSLTKLSYLIVLPVQSFIALLLNFRRMKNLLATLKRRFSKDDY